MGKVQLRVFVETTDEDSVAERNLLRYVQDMFEQEYDGFSYDINSSGERVLIFKSKLERGW